MDVGSVCTAMSRASTMSLLCFAVTVSLASTGCGGAKEVPGPDKGLATIERGFQLSSDESTLDRITAMLDKLQTVCVGNSRVQLADATASAVQALDRKGLRVPPTQVLTDAVTGSGIFGNIPVDDCRPMFPMLVRHYLA
ncbi:MAG: hypothetical protein ACRDPV_10940 [Gaiellaceae bacterium]